MFRSGLSTHRVARLVPHIAAYRQTPFTVTDWTSEHTPTARYHVWWEGEALRAYCKTEETRTGRLYLSSFLVNPAFRGTHTGTTFLASLLGAAHMRGYEHVLLKVHEDNLAAQRLYGSAGFTSKQKWNQRYEMERMM